MSPQPPAFLWLHRPWLAGSLTGLTIVAVAAAGWLGAQALHPIPATVRQGINFPLYYPRDLPAGYRVDRESFTQQDQVVIFTIASPNGKNVVASQQRLPIGLDLSHRPNPAGLKLPGERDFTTSIGAAHLSLWGNKTVISLVAENTWILFNVTDIPTEDAIHVASAFQPL